MSTPVAQPSVQPNPATPPATPKRRRGLWIAIGLVTVAGATVALAPTLVGFIAPSLVPRFVQFQGSVRLESASFSWFGEQRLGGLRLADPQGAPIATLDLSIGEGLLEILSGNLGAVRVSGDVDIVRSADGTTNLERALAPRSPAPAAPAQPAAATRTPLRKGTSATIDLSAARIRFRDEAPRGGAAVPSEATFKDVAAKISLAIGQPIVAEFKATTEAGGRTGSLTGRAEISQWHDAARVVDAGPNSNASINATIVATDVPVVMGDFILGRTDLAATLGASLSASVSLAGKASDASMRLQCDAPNLKASADLALRDSVVTSTSATSVEVRGDAISLLAQTYVPALKGENPPARIITYPNVTITVDSLKAKLPEGSAFDWRGIGLAARIQTSTLSGSLQAGEGTRAFSISPIAATLDARDLANSISLKASTSATLDNTPAGTIDIDVATGGLTTNSGELVKGVPPGLTGRATIRNIASAIAQPFVQGLGLDLPAQIGPTLDASLVAKAGADGTSSDLSLTVESRELKISGDLFASTSEIRSTKPISIDARSAGVLAAALAGDKSPWALSPKGGARVVVERFSVPLSSARTPVLASSSAEITIDASGFAFAAREAKDAAPVLLESLNATLGLSAGGTISLVSTSQLSHQGQRSTVDARTSLPGVLSDDPARRVNTDRLAESAFSLAARSLPSSLASLLLKPSEPGSVDTASLVADVLGTSIDVQLDSAPVAGGKESRITGSLRSAGLSAELAGSLTPQQFSLATLTADANLSPELADRVLPKLVADPQSLPRLVSPSTIRLSARPITIPLGPGLIPDRDAAEGTLAFDITTDRPLLARTPTSGAAPSSIVGLTDLRLIAESPVPAILSGAKGQATLSLQASALGGASPQSMSPAGTIRFAAITRLSNRAPESVDFETTIDQLSSAWLDDLSGKPGLATGALGPQSTLRLTGTAPSPADLSKAPIDASISISSPTITADPLRLSISADRLVLRNPWNATWTISPAFADQFLASPAQSSTHPLRLGAPTPFKAELSRLSIALGSGPLKPGVFDLACTLSAQNAELAASNGTKTSFSGVGLTLQREGNGIVYRLAVDQARAGDAPPAANLALAGVLTNLATPDGSFDRENVRVTAKGDLPAIPTVLLDTLASKDGLLVEALGETTAFSLDAREFGLAGGSLAATARSPRAMFELAGPVQEGVLVVPAASPLKAQVTEVTTAFSSRIVKALPLFGSVEKGPQDRPASIVGTSLRIPLSNDLTKLDGDFAIDPGEVSFQIAGDFADLLAGPILAATRGKAAGKAGQRLAPMTVQVRAGVATLQRWSVPVGEFTIAMDGRINLASGEIDFTTYIPAGALAMEKLKLPAGIGGQIAADVLKNAVIPVRTRGVGATRKTEVDSDAAAKELLKGVDPGKLIERGLQDLFKPKKN